MLLETQNVNEMIVCVGTHSACLIPGDYPSAVEHSELTRLGSVLLDGRADVRGRVQMERRSAIETGHCRLTTRAETFLRPSPTSSLFDDTVG